jgi:hypothetical protein
LENGSVPQHGPVIVRLPTGQNAAPFQASLTQHFGFTVQNYGGSVAVDLREGSGTVRKYLTATRLCGSGDILTDATWDPLRAVQPHEHDRTVGRRLWDWADEYLDATGPGDKDRLWRQMRVLRARTFLLGRELPDYLAQEMPTIFDGMPGSSLWLINVDELLLRRLMFLRAQLALTLTPDVPLVAGEFTGFRLLSAHGLTRGIDFSNALALPLVMFSPGLLGIPLSWEPHALVLVFGQAVDLHQPDFATPSSALRPPAFIRPEGWSDQPYWERLTPAEMEPLIPWWVDRLNVLYSHAADPTQFSDNLGHHDVSAQAAWFLTMERILVDTLIMASDPTAGDLVRAQLAFDVLDKTEGLLNYDESGPGFKDLLWRSKTLPRLRQAWKDLPESIPASVERRLRLHSKTTFDALYADIREHVTLPSRLTPNGIKIATTDPATLRNVAMNEYVGRLLRETRNTAHGLKRSLREDSKYILATHTGDIPPQLTHLAALIVFALVADAEKLCAGTWW